MKRIKTPLGERTRKALETGERVLLSGVLFTARDQTHERILSFIRKKKKLPFDLKGSVIYYAGPTPSPYKNKVGSCGPTTSSRMDSFTPFLLKKGVAAMIGKGKRSQAVRRLIKKYKAIYFLALGGAGAYLSKKIVKAKLIGFKDLGAQAVYKFEVKDFPLVVGIDSRGKDVYKR